MSGERQVRILSEPAIGSWRVRGRPAGPAGAFTVRLPFGLTVWLDRAEPELILELAGQGTGVAAEAVALLRLLYGARTAELVEAERSGLAGYRPEHGARADRFRALLAALGTAEERPSFTVIDLARVARELAADSEDADPAFSRLLWRIAVSCALQGVSALRVLPVRAKLNLDADGELALDRALAVVAELAGTDLSLGPIADQPEQPVEPVAGVDPLAAGVTDLMLARQVVLAPVMGSMRGPGDSWLVDLGDCPVPLQLEQLTLTEERPGVYQLAGPVTLLTAGDLDELVELAPVDSAAAPLIWARAIRRGDGVVLYAAQCVIAAGRLTAYLQLNPEYRYRDEFWIDLSTEAAAVARTGPERRAALADRQGALAARQQRAAVEPRQWAAVGQLWSRCARLWQLAGDPERRALAAIHAARAYACSSDTEAAASALASARTLAAGLDERWLAPELAGQATADPLRLGSMISLANLGGPVTAWVAGELQRAAAGVLPPLTDGYLKLLLDLRPRAADPGYGRLRRLRARARVAVAYQASEHPETLPLASALLAPASADWPYLDEEGRRRFAAVHSRVMGPDAADPVS